MSEPAVDHESKEWEEARKRVNVVVNGFFELERGRR